MAFNLYYKTCLNLKKLSVNMPNIILYDTMRCNEVFLNQKYLQVKLRMFLTSCIVAMQPAKQADQRDQRDSRARARSARTSAKRQARIIHLQSHHCLCSSNRSPGERFVLIGYFISRDPRMFFFSRTGHDHVR